MTTEDVATKTSPWDFAGMLVTAFRIVLGWMFFSAFWRRVVLASGKLDPSDPGYVGHKINAFMPQAQWVHGLLEYAVTHSTVLSGFLIVFTIVEGLTGLALIVGLGTRIASLGITLLSWGILMGAGWMGSTCLDEWQIGAMGVAGGIIVMLTGAGPWSLDAVWQKRWPQATDKTWLRWLSSGPIMVGKERLFKRVTAVAVIFAALLTLYTNQLFAGGVWGSLHNDSKAPHIVVSNPALTTDGNLSVTLYNDKGPDTYGAYVVAISVKDSSDQAVETFTAKELSSVKAEAISNDYLNKVKAGANSLVVPLGAKATVALTPEQATTLAPGTYTIVVMDVSGTKWTSTATVG